MAFGIRKGEQLSLEAARLLLVVNLSQSSLDAVHRDTRSALERQFKSKSIVKKKRVYYWLLRQGTCPSIAGGAAKKLLAWGQSIFGGLEQGV